MVHHSSKTQENQLRRKVRSVLWRGVAGLAIGFSSFSWAAVPQGSGDPKLVADWCAETGRAVRDLKWKIEPCSVAGKSISWRTLGKSVKGRPLVFAEFGNPQALNRTLILSSVHGDEITPVYVGLQLISWLKEHESALVNGYVVVAPMVNPDSFLDQPRSRTNSNGVDVNRNFATSDWQNTALRLWKKKYRADPRRFPGERPRSEPETLFQEELIRYAKPQKILSIHSPLNHLDYDGPTAITLSRFPREYVKECLNLRKRLKAVTTGFFPGSLGNYAGHELGIPTLTLELPSADATQAEKYWQQFSKGIKTMIEFSMPDYAKLQQ